MKFSRITKSVRLFVLVISVLLTVCLGFSVFALAQPTRMMDGRQAINWLIQHKYIDPVTHIPMHNFYLFRSGVLGASYSGPHGLKALLAEGWKFTGRMNQPIKNAVIIVDVRFTGGGSTITVVSATYGGNCRTFTPTNGTANTVHRGNATTFVKRVCDGQTTCNYIIRWQNIGDPVYGCVKDFIVEWRCSGSPTVKTHHVPAPPEAGFGSTASLTCP